MNKYLKSTLILVIALPLFFAACAEDEDTVELQPTVELLAPEYCDTIWFDEPFTFKIRVTDPGKEGLGALSFDTHHNFDHHTHGSHLPCDMDPKKDAVRPFEEVWIHDLPDNEIDFVFEKEITIPSVAGEDAYHDHGDYHFHIYVTNSQGYQTFTTLDYKLMYREGHPDDPWK